MPDQDASQDGNKKGHTFSLTSKAMQTSARMLRLMFTIVSFLQRRSWTRISRPLLRLANSLQRLGSLLSWARHLTMPLLLLARKCLASSDAIGHSSAASFRGILEVDIAISRRDHEENRGNPSTDITSKSPSTHRARAHALIRQAAWHRARYARHWSAIPPIIAVDKTRFPGDPDLDLDRVDRNTYTRVNRPNKRDPGWIFDDNCQFRLSKL